MADFTPKIGGLSDVASGLVNLAEYFFDYS